MDPKTEQALLRAVCTLIDTGRFELGKEETTDPTEQAVVNFMRGLRIGSQVSYGGAPNTWALHIVRTHDALLHALKCAEGALSSFQDRQPSPALAAIVKQAREAIAEAE